MIDIIKEGTYHDGGTSIWINPDVKKELKTIDDAKNCQKYYLDNRIGSQTKGELFDKYPGDKDAIILDKSQFNFINNKS